MELTYQNVNGELIGVIEKDGFNICDKIDSYISTNRNTQRIKGLGLLLLGLSQTIERENPDFLLVIGDREESIATALVGNYMNILVAHYGGGDTCLWKMQTIQLGCNFTIISYSFNRINQSSKKLESVGEDKFRIFTVGNPAYDNISSIFNRYPYR